MDVSLGPCLMVIEYQVSKQGSCGTGCNSSNNQDPFRQNFQQKNKNKHTNKQKPPSPISAGADLMTNKWFLVGLK